MVSLSLKALVTVMMALEMLLEKLIFISKYQVKSDVSFYWNFPKIHLKYVRQT